jgi:LmbE family N-acetylglucosaminyl deacetylase
VHVVAMTAGERALAHLGRHPPDLRDRRRRELYAACAALRVSTTQVIGLADGGLAAAETEAIGTVEDLLRRHRPAHVLTTWWDNPHADPAALGAMTRGAAVRAGIPVSDSRSGQRTGLIPTS